MMTSRRKVIFLCLIACLIIVGVAAACYFIGRHVAQCNTHPPTDDGASIVTSLPGTSIVTSLPQPTGRLPRNIEPILYKLEIFPQIYSSDPRDFYFRGYVHLRFKCVEKSNNVTLNLNKLTLLNETIAFGTLNMHAVDNELVSHYTTDSKWQFVTFHLRHFMEEGVNYVIQMNFTGPLKTDFAGFYLSTFHQRSANKYVVATQFSPTDARKAFPCLDEPDRKAQFDVTLVRRKDMISLSNMPVASRQAKGNGMVADVFERTPKMSTYLLAFVIGDLVSRDMPARTGLNFTAWSGKETVNKTQNALEFGARALTTFENYFGIEFPLPKQDIVAVPETAVGAMENWGLIIFNEARMYYDPKEYSKQSLKRSVNTIAHEIAHQWFGNLVTMEWWSDLMLKEGFANYFEDVAVDSVYPDWGIMDQFVLKMHSVFEVDGMASSHPVYMKLYDTTQIRQVFDDISYTKGGCMIRMLNFILGDQMFQNGMKRYLTKHQFGNVRHDDLWSALDNAEIAISEQSTDTDTTIFTTINGVARQQNTNVDKLLYENSTKTYQLYGRPNIKDIMDTWVLQKSYPVVTVRYIGGGRLHIAQDCFLNNTDKPVNTSDSPFRYIWKIPLTFTSSVKKTFNHTYRGIIWMESTDLVVVNKELPDIHRHGNWILCNIKQWGYYRVNYDVSNWLNLIDQLKRDHSEIDVTNRAQIINDIFSLAKTNRLPLEIALTALEYLNNETSFIPWVTALKEIRFIEKFIKNTALFKSYKILILKFTRHILDILNRKKGLLGTMDSILRARLFKLCSEYDMQECIELAKAEFSAWRENKDKNRMDVEVRSEILCTSLKFGDTFDWELVLQEFSETYNTNDRKAYLKALTCTRQAQLLDRLLILTEDDKIIQGQDAIFALTNLAQHSESQDKVFDYVANHWLHFMNKYTGSLFSLDKLVVGVTDTFVTHAQLQRVEEFVKQTSNLGPAARTFRQVMENIKFNVKWSDANYNVVEKWVQKNLKA